MQEGRSSFSSNSSSLNSTVVSSHATSNLVQTRWARSPRSEQARVAEEQAEEMHWHELHANLMKVSWDSSELCRGSS